MLACVLALVLTLLPPAWAAGTLTVETSMWNLPFGGGGTNFTDGSAVTTDGSLYVWGDIDTLPGNGQEELPPTKTGSGYRAAGLGWAVKTDGGLYVWKNGTRYDSFTKVMDGVLYYNDGYVLKMDGTLLEIGDGKDFSKTTQVLTNVRQFDWTIDFTGPVYGNAVYAVTSSGDLYACKKNGSQYSSEKVMGDISAVCMGAGSVKLAIQKDGSLRAWGILNPDMDGKGTDLKAENAVRLLDNVVSVSADLAVTADGTLYALGENGNMGSTPVRLMSGAAAVHETMLLKQDGSLWYDGGYDGGHDFSKLMDNVSLGGSGSASQPGTPSQPDTPSNPASGSIMTGSTSLSTLSKQEIIDLLNQNPTTMPAKVFDVTPSCSAPHTAGKLSDEALQAALNRLNALRRICGIPATTLSKEWSETAQYGAVVLGALGNLSHTPSQHSAGYFPNDLAAFMGNSPWTVELNPDVYAKPSGITVKLSGGGKSWTLSGSYKAADTGAYLGVMAGDAWNYGGSHCIIFRPDGVTKYEGT